MQRLVHVTAIGLALWTLFHVGFVAIPEHAVECDDCPVRPWSDWWVTASRVGAWAAAVVAVGRASDAPTRARVALMACALLALVAAMLLLPTPPYSGGLLVKNPTSGALAQA